MAYWELHAVTEHENIFGCEVFFEEFQSLYKKDKTTARQYQKWLDRQFNMLSRNPIETLLSQNAFEKVHGINEGFDLYSLRRPEFSGNPRILFSSLILDDGQVYILLLAFKELHNDYDVNIPIAVKRMKPALPRFYTKVMV